MEFFLIWVAFGILCAFIAPGRGRGGFAWFVLGFLFGPFSLVALLAMPNLARTSAHEAAIQPTIPSQERPAHYQQVPDTKTCPRCAETIKLAAVVCRYCGHEFSQSPEQRFRSGDWVQHTFRGKGIVLDVANDGFVKVRFNDGEAKINQDYLKPA